MGRLRIKKKTCPFLDETGKPAAQQRDSSRLKKDIFFSWSVTDPFTKCIFYNKKCSKSYRTKSFKRTIIPEKHISINPLYYIRLVVYPGNFSIHCYSLLCTYTSVFSGDIIIEYCQRSEVTRTISYRNKTQIR